MATITVISQAKTMATITVIATLLITEKLTMIMEILMKITGERMGIFGAMSVK